MIEGKKVQVKKAVYGEDISVEALKLSSQNEFYFKGGVDVFVDGKKVAWFMELTNYCCC